MSKLDAMDSFGTEHDPKSIQAAIERAAASALELSFRPMFGGIMGYVGGRPFASISNRGLALKLDARGQTELLAHEGARRLQYDPTDAPSKTYVLVPDRMLSSPDMLRPWLEQSATFVMAQAVRKPRPQKPGKH